MAVIDSHRPSSLLHDAEPTSGWDFRIVRLRSAGRLVVNPVVMRAGPVVAILTVVASIVGGVSAWSPAVPSWTLAVALAALALGVPHGAVDHVAISTASSTAARLVGRTMYLGAAVAAALFILRVPGVAFVAVLLMSVWHFGTGDVEAAADLTDREKHRRPVRVLQVLALGSAPVVLPLTSPSAVTTVALINPGLAQVLTPNVSFGARLAVFGLIILTLGLLLRAGDRRGAGELTLLAVLSVVASPIIAFAVYFAAWHALRHTARLAMSENGDVHLADLARTFAAGLPALVVTAALAAVCVVTLHGSETLGTWLWIGLAMVWGLTVPHMITVARFDGVRRRQRHASARRSAASRTAQ